jgi:fluoroacetyl-CoA thioesterase
VTPGAFVLTLSAVPLSAGLSATTQMMVSDDDTAIAYRSGDVPVLATPRVIALVEEAAVLATDGRLQTGCSTVGVRVQLEHISPTPVGGVVTAEASLEKVEGRRLTFHVSARDERGLVAAGKVTRVLVDVEQFLEKTR